MVGRRSPTMLRTVPGSGPTLHQPPAQRLVINLRTVPRIQRQWPVAEDYFVHWEFRCQNPRTQFTLEILADHVGHLDHDYQPLPEGRVGSPTAATRRMCGSSPAAACSINCG